MRRDAAARPRAALRYLTILAWCAIVLGSALRFSQLSERALFVDEAITQLRVAGHTDAQLMRLLYDGKQRTVGAVRRYAEVDASSSVPRVVASLAREDAQHPPLFYVVELGVVRVLGNGLFVWRLVPALFGLLAVGAAYALAAELFADRSAGLLAAAAFAVSPIERIYSEQAREYSLLALATLVATLVVVKAFRTDGARWWALYAIVAAGGLYADPFMAYVIVAHAVVALAIAFRARARPLVRFAAAASAALVAYSPWMYELAAHRGGIVAENAWSAGAWPVGELLIKWAFNLGSALFDLEYLDLRWGVVLALVAVVAAIAALRAFRDADSRARWVLGATILVPAVLLIAPDVILREHRSAVTRYGLPVLAMVPIVVAGGLRRRPLAATVILGAGLCACAVSAMHASWWDNDTDADDVQIAAAVDRVPHAQLISAMEPPAFLAFARVLDGGVRVSLGPNLGVVAFSAADPIFVLEPGRGDLARLQRRTGLGFEIVPYARTVTAHEIGEQMRNDPSARARVAELYRAVPRGVSREAASNSALQLAGAAATRFAPRRAGAHRAGFAARSTSRIARASPGTYRAG